MTRQSIAADSLALTFCCWAVAEGGAYGEKAAGGNSFSYWFLAVTFAGAAALAAVAPHIVSVFTLQGITLIGHLSYVLSAAVYASCIVAH